MKRVQQIKFNQRLAVSRLLAKALGTPIDTNSVVRLLKRAGAKRVAVWSIARAV